MDRAFEQDLECAAILNKGPGLGTPGCADYDAAIEIFNEVLDACKPSPTDLPSAISGSSEGPKKDPGEVLVKATTV